MTTLVFDALITSSHKYARRIVDKMRGSYASAAFGKNVVKLAPQEVYQIGSTDLLVVQYDSTLGDVCEVGWEQDADTVKLRVQQQLLIDSPLTGAYIKNLTPAESSTYIVVKVITSKK